MILPRRTSCTGPSLTPTREEGEIVDPPPPPFWWDQPMGLDGTRDAADAKSDFGGGGASLL